MPASLILFCHVCLSTSLFCPPLLDTHVHVCTQMCGLLNGVRGSLVSRTEQLMMQKSFLRKSYGPSCIWSELGILIFHPDHWSQNLELPVNVPLIWEIACFRWSIHGTKMASRPQDATPAADGHFPSATDVSLQTMLPLTVFMCVPGLNLDFLLPICYLQQHLLENHIQMGTEKATGFHCPPNVSTLWLLASSHQRCLSKYSSSQKVLWHLSQIQGLNMGGCVMS